MDGGKERVVKRLTMGARATGWTYIDSIDGAGDGEGERSWVSAARRVTNERTRR